MHLKARAHTAPRHPPLTGALLDRVQDHLAAMRHRELGRDIGCCERCGKHVRSEQHFIRQDGQIAHVRCRITRPPTRPALR